MTPSLRIVIAFALSTMGIAVTRSAAQSESSALAAGIAAMTVHDYTTARLRLTEAVREAPKSYDANWRLSMALINIGQQTPDSIRSPARDSLYAEAESYARHAVAAKTAGADGHFALGTAIGHTSLTQSKKERIKNAAEIYTEAHRALELNPTHDGAYHLLGRWHAEIMRLSGLQKFFAKNFMGAGIFNEASWDAAERNLVRAVTLDPNRIFHRLDLALVLVDREKWREARAQVDTLLALPPSEPMDLDYRRQAQRLSQRIAAKLKS